jgi:hypothetical protein
MDPKWLEHVGQQHKFKAGDKVICKESHRNSPEWHCHMEAFVGAHGTVLAYITTRDNEYVRVTFSPRLSKTDWCFLEDWLMPAGLVPAETQDNTQDKMTSPSSTPSKATETFTTTWSLDITLTDGKVTAVNVHPPAEPKPKFAAGDIVVCKAKARQMPKSHAWTNEMTLMLNIPGRVSSVDSKYKLVYVEFGGYQTAWAYPEECLEHETSEMAAAMNQVFSRLDKARRQFQSEFKTACTASPPVH